VREVLARCVQLGAVAGRDHHRLAQAARRHQRGQRGLEPTRLKIQPLAQVDRCGPVAHPDEEKMHHEIRSSTGAKSCGWW
jgi:hypothetical protein